MDTMDKDEQIKKLTEENEKLMKLNSVKAEMVSISAHQVRTSLSALKWIVKMFLDGDLGTLTSEQKNLMKKAYEGTDRAVNIVSELLLLNKTEDVVEQKYDFSKVDVEDLIDSAMFDFFGEAHMREIEIIFLKPENKVSDVKADKEKLRVVLQNLLENSIKYSNPKSKIFITMAEKDNFVEVSVKDTGIGISEEGKNKIFEKFYRDPKAEKKEAIGSGIGLFTTKKIVENHGGKIWFDSKEGDGTTFFFTIPVFSK